MSLRAVICTDCWSQLNLCDRHLAPAPDALTRERQTRLEILLLAAMDAAVARRWLHERFLRWLVATGRVGGAEDGGTGL